MVLPFLALLMLVLTGMSVMAHAAEMNGGRLLGVEFTVHAPGDGDEVPADGDNGLPHHHNSCHGHDVSTPASTPLPCALVIGSGPTAETAAPAILNAALRVRPRPPKG